MGIIIKLDPHLANMIAAGEVVERVGNVVKELMENAIDANASVIAIELKESGLAAIRVADNGSGMEADDALAAFERHATSKIRSERDLFRIASLGFRGEALPSIAAVSRVELVTSTGGAAGRKVVYRDGALLENGLCSAAKGTSVTVTKLFYNTPARLKFLKSPHAELAFIAELVDKYAIARPDIAFSLSNDNRMLVRTSGNNDRSAVVAAVYGVAAAKEMVPFAGANRDYRVKGRLASPIVNRVSRSYVTVAVNGRVVRNPKAVQAIVEGYGQTIPKGRYPIVFVDIATDPLLIDVNIHPTKLEIKFSEEASLMGLLTETIRKAVGGFRII
ncbi:MAG: DNA mismatch repair endonuclease MutL, partial [bacterium]